MALDFAGHGASDHRVGTYHPADHVQDVVDVLFQLGWFVSAENTNDRPAGPRVIVIGHSMGGGVAAMLAGAFPSRIHALIMIEAIGPWPGIEDMAAQNLREAIMDGRRRFNKDQRKSKRRSYPTVLAAAERRAAGNRVGTLPVSAAVILCTRGLRELPGGSGFVWSADPALLGPTRVKLSPGQALNFINKINARTLVITTQNGILERPARVLGVGATLSPFHPLVRTLMRMLAYCLRLVRFMRRTFAALFGAFWKSGAENGPDGLMTIINSLEYGLGLQDRLIALRRSLGKGLTHVHLPDGGHHPHLVIGETVANRIQDFVSRPSTATRQSTA